MTKDRLTIDEERQLVEGIGRGDRDAISLFYEQYKSLFYGTIRKFTFIPYDEADDYFQEFFSRLMENDWRRLMAWRGDSRLSTYLVSSLRNYILDQKRKAVPVESFDANEDELGSENPTGDMEDEMDKKTLLNHLKDCARQLSDRDQEIFNRHFVRDEDAAVIAEALGVSMNAYYQAIHNTKSRLSRCLETEFPFLFNTPDGAE
jgi:RNA polymerase sigma factor (sigma-70 family)